MTNTMSTSNGLDLQVRWLQALQMDVKSFGPNQINMIKGYLPHTEIHTKMIEVFKQMRQILMTSLDDSLHFKYDQGRRDFNKHIGRRIVCLTNLNPRMLDNGGFKVKTSVGKKNLRETIFYIQDLLIDIELVVKYDIQEGWEVIGSEIKELIRVLPRYFSKIEENSRGRSQAFVQKLQQVEEYVNRHDFEQADGIFSEINAQLSLQLTEEINRVQASKTYRFAWIPKLCRGCCVS